VQVVPTQHGVDFHLPGGVISAYVVTGDQIPQNRDAFITSLFALVKKKGLETYRVGDQQFMFPASIHGFRRLAEDHVVALMRRFSVAGQYSRATDIILVNQKYAHDPSVWSHELTHAGLARLTAAERKAAGLPR
jgi:hypothetical protein